MLKEDVSVHVTRIYLVLSMTSRSRYTFMPRIGTGATQFGSIVAATWGLLEPTACLLRYYSVGSKLGGLTLCFTLPVSI